MSISLVGMPGSGKSTVGRNLARRLGRPFHDSDHAIEQRIGCSIRDFFAREGEAAFRDIEEQVIGELAALPDAVLATGGGAVLRPANREHLRAGGHVIYLRSSPEDLFRRLRHDTQRPLLQVADPLARLRQMYAERDPLYRETAHYVLETGRPSVATLVNMILMQLDLAP
ncbi:shikimate kinase [Ramlibacter albus]|uniref:Shikimate kinase n=1 Tax=Ramlibacter albus TaxID=2079448 RepID=A0A923M6F9_9BURK|nr:shikimate kinase [Ramlibacter albus]MBC5764835.1 shikimate kinase [Ramlibacter albus]